MSDFLCVCQLSSRFTRQCHASTCHIVCGYMSYMHWDGAYSLQSESSGSGLCTSLHLEVSGTPGRRDRLPYLRSNSKQSCRRPIQVKNWILTWHCEMRNAWHHDIMTLQIFRSKSWLHILHLYLLLSRVQPSNFYEFLNSFLTSQDTFRVLKTLTAYDCLSCSCAGPFALGCCHTARELSLREARNWWKLHISACIASASLVFLEDSAAWLELRWLHTKCQRMSKTRYTKE